MAVVTPNAHTPPGASVQGAVRYGSQPPELSAVAACAGGSPDAVAAISAAAAVASMRPDLICAPPW
jgi:hypothetical protein